MLSGNIQMGILRKKKQAPLSRPVPRHIAIIMDGNGRWAAKRGMPRSYGHAAGSETFRRVATYCKDIGVEYLTVYAFSTENWKRSAEEVSAIMQLLEKYLQEALAKMERDRVKICFMGDLQRLSPQLQALCADAVEKSRHFEGVQLNICLNYGGRDEILHAAREFARRCMEGECRPEDLDEAAFSGLLYSRGVPDPDLIIRPSGEQRLSNFLLWQAAYAELYYTDVLWPDFTPEELEKAIAAYNGRSRRYGGVK